MTQQPKLPTKLILVKELPGCPIGRIFLLSVDMKYYYHFMTNAEHDNPKLQYYRLKSSVVLNQLDEWFKKR